jgi:hypothetical protein
MSFLPDICLGGFARMGYRLIEKLTMRRLPRQRNAQVACKDRNERGLILLPVSFRKARKGHYPIGCIAQLVEHTLLVISISRFGLPLDNAYSKWSRKNFVEKLLNGVIMIWRTSCIPVQLNVLSRCRVRSTPSAGDRW